MTLKTTSLRWGAALATIPVVAFGISLPSAANGDEPRLRAGTLETVLSFTFNNGESLKRDSRVRDASGHRNFGTVVTSGGGTLSRVRGVTGRAAKFPGGCRACGRAIIETSDGKGLEPRARPFHFGASVKITERQTKSGKDPNIVQKGLQARGAAQWKLELVVARPRCIVRGSAGRVKVASSEPIDDGTWHTLQCSRVGKTVTLRIDGAVVNRSSGATGKLVNGAPVRVGGKGVGRTGSGNDQYHGALDDIFVEINRR